MDFTDLIEILARFHNKSGLLTFFNFATIQEDIGRLEIVSMGDQISQSIPIDGIDLCNQQNISPFIGLVDFIYEAFIALDWCYIIVKSSTSPIRLQMSTCLVLLSIPFA